MTMIGKTYLASPKFEQMMGLVISYLMPSFPPSTHLNVRKSDQFTKHYIFRNIYTNTHMKISCVIEMWFMFQYPYNIDYFAPNDLVDLLSHSLGDFPSPPTVAESESCKSLL